MKIILIAKCKHMELYFCSLLLPFIVKFFDISFLLFFSLSFVVFWGSKLLFFLRRLNHVFLVKSQEEDTTKVLVANYEKLENTA